MKHVLWAWLPIRLKLIANAGPIARSETSPHHAPWTMAELMRNPDTGGILWWAESGLELRLACASCAASRRVGV